MLNRIVIPLILATLFIAVQLIIIPFISVQEIIPNVVLIFVILYSLRFGKISGMLFGFFVGFFFDIASGGFVGSGMFAFTIAAFIAGYFFKDEFSEVIYNRKVFLPMMFFVSTLFFIIYSVLGLQSIEVKQNFSILLYSLLCSLYTVVLSLGLFLIPKDKL